MKKARVLIVENEKVTATVLRQTLERIGYDVAGVIATGEEAISRVRAEAIDIILMDIALDDVLDGIHTAHCIRRTRDVPIIYITSRADEETIQRAKFTEPFAFLPKPIEAKGLQATNEISLFKYATAKASAGVR